MIHVALEFIYKLKSCFVGQTNDSYILHYRIIIIMQLSKKQRRFTYQCTKKLKIIVYERTFLSKAQCLN